MAEASHRELHPGSRGDDEVGVQISLRSDSQALANTHNWLTKLSQKVRGARTGTKNVAGATFTCAE